MEVYKFFRDNLLFRLDPEIAHEFMLRFGRLLNDSYVFQDLLPDDPILRTDIAGVELKHPVGLAAGFDKNAELLGLAEILGFSHIDRGSFTARNEGNKKPRMFRLVDDHALVNRLGLNSDGREIIEQRLEEEIVRIPYGVNIAKTNDPKLTGDEAIRDVVETFTLLERFGSYIMLNLSCPNTSDGRSFEDKQYLRELLSALREIKPKYFRPKPEKPVFVKLSPDLTFSGIDNIIIACQENGIAGYNISNTTRNRNGLRTSTEELERIGNGGLSGRPLDERAIQLIKYLYQCLALGHSVPQIIGIGGIEDGETAYRRIRAGASALQLYTALVYEGPLVARKTKRELADLLRRDGFTSVKEAVGIDASQHHNGRKIISRGNVYPNKPQVIQYH